MNEPDYQDLVKNKKNNVTGTVIAKYPESNLTTSLKKRKTNNLLDIRLETGGGDRGIWYESPAEFWEVIKPYEGSKNNE